MVDQMQVQQLLRDLGSLVGVSGLDLDKEGRCALLIDDKLEVEVSFTEGDSRLVLAALLGELPADTPPEHYAMLLDANFFWRGTNGATLGVERESRTVVLIDSLPVVGLYAGSLEAKLGAFVNSAQEWMNRIAGKLDETTDAGNPGDGPHRAGDVILPA